MSELSRSTTQSISTDDFGTPMSGNVDLDEFDRATSAFPDISLDGEGDFPTPAPAMARGDSNGFSFDDFDAPPSDVKVTGDDEIDTFESNFPDIEEPQSAYSPPPMQQQPSFGTSSPFAPRPQPSAFSNTPILSQPLDEEEPEVIKEWREKQAEEIKARDEASKARRQETIAKAERSIDEFYAEHASKKERIVRENKEEEAEYLEKLQTQLANGTTWERICELIELQNSQSKTLARTAASNAANGDAKAPNTTTDLTRFKEVLLRLKREGSAAPGAGGY